MFRKFVFISVLLSIFLSGMFLTFSQEAAPPSTQPDATRRQYDHEFDRLSEEERRRLHMGRGNEEQDQSMRRSQMPVRDDAGTDSAQNNRTSANQSNTQTNNSTREQARQSAERYMRSNYPEMSERELDEMIERMLDQLIEQLEARIENRTRVRLKRQLVSFLQRLIKKYRVDPATAEDMTRERARREIEGIRNNREQTTPAARRRNSSDTRRQSSTNNRNGNESYAPPMTSESRERVNRETENNTEMTPEEERRVAQAQRQNSSRQPESTRQRSTRRRQAGVAQRNRDRYVEVSNPERRQTRRNARRVSARRQMRRASAAQPAFAIKRFIIGSDKNGLVIRKASPVLVTFTIHTNNGAGKYVIASFTAISVKDRKQYKIHTTKKFLILDRRSQYQFYWSSEMDSADKLLPNGKYKIYVTAAIHNAAGRVIAKPGRLWGGTSNAMTVTANNQQVSDNQSEDRPPAATNQQESTGTTTGANPPAGNNQPPAGTRADSTENRQQ